MEGGKATGDSVALHVKAGAYRHQLCHSSQQHGAPAAIRQGLVIDTAANRNLLWLQPDTSRIRTKVVFHVPFQISVKRSGVQIVEEIHAAET